MAERVKMAGATTLNGGEAIRLIFEKEDGQFAEFELFPDEISSLLMLVSAAASKLKDPPGEPTFHAVDVDAFTDPQGNYLLQFQGRNAAILPVHIAHENSKVLQVLSTLFSSSGSASSSRTH